MGELTAVIAFITELIAVAGVIFTTLRRYKKIADGTKCQLRSEMLRIYYHCKETKRLRQYEYENFVFLYEAYKGLGGNSFIDKIYSEIKECEIET